MEGLEETKALISEVNPSTEVLIVKVDVSIPEDFDHLVKVVKEKWGRIDYAVNAAGEYYIHLLIRRLPLIR